MLAVDNRHVAFCEYNSSVARIICVAVATLANKKILERASDNDLLLCRKSTSNKTRYRQWFDRCIISKMILKSGSNWLFPVVFSVEITLSRSPSGNSFEFSHGLTGFLNYALFCLSFCLRLNLKPVKYLTTRIWKSLWYAHFCLIFLQLLSFLLAYIDSYFLQRRICFLFVSLQFEFCLKGMDYNYKCQQNIMISFGEYHVFIVWLFSNFDKALLKRLSNIECSVYLMFKACCLSW